MAYNRHPLILASVCFLSFLIVPANAAVGVVTGSEWRFWVSDVRNSVIVGRVRHIENADQPGWATATLTPSFTVAGAFDASLENEIQIVFCITAGGFGTSSIEKPPAEGAIVMAVIRTFDNNGKQMKMVRADFCNFMPGRSALVELNGFDDPRIQQTLERIQEARRNEDPSPYPKKREDAATSQPTTEPATP